MSNWPLAVLTSSFWRMLDELTWSRHVYTHRVALPRRGPRDIADAGPAIDVLPATYVHRRSLFFRATRAAAWTTSTRLARTRLL
jgi:hypothetical protein